MTSHVAPIVTRAIARTTTEVKFGKADRRYIRTYMKPLRKAAARAERHAVRNILRDNDWNLEDVI